MKKVSFALTLCFFTTQLFSAEPTDVLDDLVPPEKSPRPLSSEDVGLSTDTPLPLRPLQADFNEDGVTDHAISGTYNLPGSGDRFFLLVGSERLGPKKPRTLFFREFSEPVFIHPKGTTGEADPGNQCFSISFCQGCDQGLDFYWDKKSQSFVQKTWSARIIKTKKLVETKGEDVPPESVDEALRLVGALQDVQDHVKKMKKHAILFKTRVEGLPADPTGQRVRVKILEGKKESVWDEIDVDLKQKSILKRKRKIKPTARDRF